jgi:hypothetical protein
LEHSLSNSIYVNYLSLSRTLFQNTTTFRTACMARDITQQTDQSPAKRLIAERAEVRIAVCADSEPGASTPIDTQNGKKENGEAFSEALKLQTPGIPEGRGSGSPYN